MLIKKDYGRAVRTADIWNSKQAVADSSSVSRSRQYIEEQTIAVLREGEAGAKVADLCRKYGMSDATYYNWKARYAGLTVS